MKSSRLGLAGPDVTDVMSDSIARKYPKSQELLASLTGSLPV